MREIITETVQIPAGRVVIHYLSGNKVVVASPEEGTDTGDRDREPIRINGVDYLIRLDMVRGEYQREGYKLRERVQPSNGSNILTAHYPRDVAASSGEWGATWESLSYALKRAENYGEPTDGARKYLREEIIPEISRILEDREETLERADHIARAGLADRIRAQIGKLEELISQLETVERRIFGREDENPERAISLDLAQLLYGELATDRRDYLIRPLMAELEK